MGSGKAFSLPETDDTRHSAAMAFADLIIEKILKSGGKVINDEVTPLYTDIGINEFEIGELRNIEFHLGKKDFLLTQKVETKRITGSGKIKSLEDMKPPRITNTLKSKDEVSSEWIVIDLEGLF